MNFDLTFICNKFIDCFDKYDICYKHNKYHYIETDEMRNDILLVIGYQINYILSIIRYRNKNWLSFDKLVKDEIPLEIKNRGVLSAENDTYLSVCLDCQLLSDLRKYLLRPNISMDILIQYLINTNKQCQQLKRINF